MASTMMVVSCKPSFLLRKGTVTSWANMLTTNQEEIRSLYVSVEMLYWSL